MTTSTVKEPAGASTCTRSPAASTRVAGARLPSGRASTTSPVRAAAAVQPVVPGLAEQLVRAEDAATPRFIAGIISMPLLAILFSAIGILGAWLVQTYKGTFDTEINKSGVDGLIKTLAAKNQSLAKGK